MLALPVWVGVADAIPVTEGDRTGRIRKPDRKSRHFHQMNLSRVIEHVGHDLRCGIRQLCKSPGFTLTAVLTLALGIGANTVMFSVLNAVMLRPLPFAAADRLVRVFSLKDGIKLGPSALDLRDFALRNHTFEKLAVYDQWPKNITTSDRGGSPEWRFVGLVPAEFFEVLGIQPILGRLFTPEENTVDHNHVALITESFWKSHYAKLPSILGQTVIVNDEPYTIIGILPDAIPAWMDGANLRIEIWEPFLPVPEVFDESSRDGRDFETVGLLKPGVTIQQARADLKTIAASLAAEHPVDRGYGATLEPLTHAREGDLGPQLLLLMGAVTLVLLIACSNLASLLLARNLARQREFATRAALGASQNSLVRQILIETLLVSWTGGACGVVLASLIIGVLRHQHPPGLSQLNDLGLDWRVLLFAFVIATATNLLFGMLPALLHSRVSFNRALKEGGRNSDDRSRQFFRRMLVAGQIALSLMLTIGAGLLIQTMVRLQNQDLGFPTRHLLTARFYLPPAQYRRLSEAITQFCDAYGRSVRSSPGVQNASITTIYFPDENWRLMFSIPGRPVFRAEDVPSTLFGVVDPYFLRTAGIPVLRGRDFSESDTENSPVVAIVNQTFAKRYFTNEDPVGKRVQLGAPPESSAKDIWLDKQNVAVTVVGVMKDAKNLGLTRPIEPQLIALFRQMPMVNFGFKDIIVRSEIPPSILASTLEQQLRLLDPRLALSGISSMEQNINDLTSDRQFTSAILASFAALGVSLSVLGIYGLVSYLVLQRTQELSIRQAIGATPIDVLWLILRQGLRLALLGVGAGLLGVVLLVPILSNLLFDISPLDPITLAAASLALLLVTLLATALPGRNAMRIDPIRALRSE
ncbi:MAG: ABC transporter permease [Verrucomicrobia bacterium]|nr:ABC transporter permease [Verrucomicrobiota bacterium]